MHADDPIPLIAWSAHRCVTSAVGPPAGTGGRSDRRLRGDEIKGGKVSPEWEAFCRADWQQSLDGVREARMLGSGAVVFELAAYGDDFSLDAAPLDARPIRRLDKLGKGLAG
jgi:hypothetical protein